MKFSTIFLNCAVLSIALVQAKNVAQLSFSDEVIAELEKEAAGEDKINKRSPKNVADLNIVVNDADLEKRSPKNVYDTVHLVVDDSLLEKRSAKNVAHLHLEIDESTLNGDKKLQKRSPKNVAKLDLVVDEDELISRLAKRNAKNVVDLDLVIDEDDVSSKKVKRNGEDFTQLTMNLKGSELPDSTEVPGDSIYSLVIDIPHKIAAKLSDGFHQLKLKISDKGSSPSSEKQGSFVIPEIGNIYDVEKKLKYTLMPSVKSGSLATALTQQSELSIFAAYVRDLSDIYDLFASTDEFNINAASSSNNMLLLFAPTNDAMMKLSLRPWQFPKAISERDSDAIAKDNIRHFVECHVAKVSSKAFDSDRTVKLNSLNGNTIFLKNTESGFKYRMDDADEWSSIEKIELLDNGALLDVSKALSWPGKAL
ncbi:DEKNAAC100438 [Brettanomyces naardenensis]|uniref:DEKNAAC100438 n=1 Tax=Brettanomyces naardenensis TaxID=13370 RepID=A0A448YGH3_BRENA|nr:DEKNAAC100438 [Brettanomyces naardenensis]